MEQFEMMAAALAVCMIGFPNMKTFFGKEFFHATKHSLPAVAIVLIGIPILELSHNALIQHITVVLMIISSAVEFYVTDNNYVKVVDDELIIREDGETTAIKKQDVGYRYERDDKILVLEGKGKTAKFLTPACEKLEEWLGIQR